jgi:membrane protein insertase Oxa1/YidC/SpoIIIJ
MTFAIPSSKYRERERSANPRQRHYCKGNQVMGNKMFFAFLWVIGIPLPVVIVLYMIFGGGCS